MEPAVRETIESRLLQERQRAMHLLARLEEAERTERARVEELDPCQYLRADVGPEAETRARGRLRASRESRRLLEIDDALRRLCEQPGEFGRCTECGEMIDLERLMVLPTTAVCRACRRNTTLNHYARPK